MKQGKIMSHRFGNSEGLATHKVKSGVVVGGLGLKALSLVAVAAAVAAGGHAALATTETSPNWAGYADTPATGNTFTSVSASFVVPTVTAGSTTTSGSYSAAGYSYASFWVGLDGFNSGSVEQVGLYVAAKKGGATTYDPFTEMFESGDPAGTPAVILPGWPISGGGYQAVAVGDTINVSVTYRGDNTYFLQMADTTSGGSYSTSVAGGKNPAPLRSSAEWIAEAPSLVYTNSQGQQVSVILPLANFTPITFTNAVATDSASGTYNASGPNSTQINLVPSSGLGAQASNVSGGGTEFTVATPEPAALGLMSVGGLAILFGRRKRH